MTKLRLSGNALKLIGAVTMLADHLGLLLFPQLTWLRLIGRLSFPIFAFMIAEGCRYTRSRLRYLLQIFALAVGCQIVYFVAMKSSYLSVLFTFSLAIVTIFAWQEFKVRRSLPSALLFCAAVAAVWVLNQLLTIDYGFWGCMTPVAAALCMPRRGSSPTAAETALDRLPVHVAAMGIALVALALTWGGPQLLALAALPLLLLYSGERGRLPMKYFFYIFYPAHLGIIGLLSLLI